MARVSKQTLERLADFIATLPEEQKSKCAMCNDTLVHLVKSAEVATGAPQSTVAHAIAADINEGAAPADVVSGKALNNRVEHKTKSISPEQGNKSHKPPFESEEVQHSIPPDEDFEERLAGDTHTNMVVDRMEARAKAIRFFLDLYPNLLSGMIPWPEEVIYVLRRALSKKHHPDLGGSEAMQAAINDNLNILGEQEDERKRREE